MFPKNPRTQERKSQEIDFFSRPFQLRVKMMGEENGKRWEKIIPNLPVLLQCSTRRHQESSRSVLSLPNWQKWWLENWRLVELLMKARDSLRLSSKNLFPPKPRCLWSSYQKPIWFTDWKLANVVFVLIVRHIWSRAGKVFGVMWLFFVMIFERDGLPRTLPAISPTGSNSKNNR